MVIKEMMALMRISYFNAKRKLIGYYKYEGNVERICKTIINRCWNDKGFFMVSPEHFNSFYARDFGWVVKPLLNLGYKDKVKSTIDFALSSYEKAGHITTCVSSKGKAFSLPNNYSIDSVAYILYALRLSDDDGSLTKRYKEFLENELRIIYTNYVDHKTGLIRPDKKVIGMRDFYNTAKSRCYDNVMLGLIKREADLIGLKSDLKSFDYGTLLKDYFWNGSYFNDDLYNRRFRSDSNIYAFSLGIIDDNDMKRLMVENVIRLGLDEPIPLRYCNDRYDKLSWLSIFAPRYEHDVIWMHLAFPYIELLYSLDGSYRKRAIDKLKLIMSVIEKYKNFIEVFYQNSKRNKNKNGIESIVESIVPYQSLVYSADSSMIWAAMFLDLYYKYLN